MSKIIDLVSRLVYKRQPVRPYVEPRDEFLDRGSLTLYERKLSEGYTDMMFGEGPWMRDGVQPDGNPGGKRKLWALIFVHKDKNVHVLSEHKQMVGSMTMSMGEHWEKLSPEQFLDFLVEYRMRITRHQEIDAVAAKIRHTNAA